jgi:general nucleoside transport system permease protein
MSSAGPDVTTTPSTAETAASGGARGERLERIGAQLLAILIAFAIALAIGSLLIVAYGEKPLDVYGAILSSSLGDKDGIGYVLANATPLIFSALAVAVCFKGGLFNIGVEGQYLVAMVTASWAALSLDFLPGPLLVIATLLAAVLGGMIWAAIPGVLKVKTGAHEVVTTIMLNGIAVSLVAYALNGPLRFTNAPEGQNVDLRTDVFSDKALIGDLGRSLGITPGAHLSWLFLLGVATAIVVWFLIRRTRLGYEARAVGSAPGSARAGGISIGATQLRLFLISGALAGLVGMQQILADRGYLGTNYVAALGFTGIAVAFLGQNNPIGIIGAAVVWGILARGETALQIQTDVPREFIIILQGILILVVVITYQIMKRRVAARQLQRAAAVEEAAAATTASPAEPSVRTDDGAGEPREQAPQQVSGERKEP